MFVGVKKRRPWNWKDRCVVGVAIMGVATVLVSQAPVEIEPPPAREPGGNLQMGVIQGNLPYQEFKGGKASGSEVEQFDLAARKMAIQVRYMGGSEKELLAKLQSGEIDGLVGVRNSLTSAAFFHHLMPYGPSEVAAIVSADSEASSIWDLRGTDLLVVAGSEGESFALNFGLTENLGRSPDLSACLQEFQNSEIYSGIVCDRKRAEFVLSVRNSQGLKLVSGVQGQTRGALLAAGLDDYAKDLEKGGELAGWGKSDENGLISHSTAKANSGTETAHSQMRASLLRWLPYAFSVIFALGFFLVLNENRKLSRRARFLVSEMEEQALQSERAKKSLAMEKSLPRKNRRTVLK